jgi:nucleoid-associated protein YgaU
MTEPVKPPGPPSNSGPPPTDEEAIRTAVAALAARLSPGGPPKEAPPEDGAVAPSPAVSEAAATVVPGRAVEPPKPVEAAATARAAAPSVEPPVASDRPLTRQAAPRRAIGRLLFILLVPLLLLAGAVWLLRDHPQVAALLGRGGSPAVEPKQAAAPTTPLAAPPTSPAKPDAPPPASATTPDPAPSPTAPSSTAEPVKPDSPPPATAAATPAEPPKVATPAVTTEPAKPDPALAPPTFDNVFVRDGRAVISGRAPVGSRVEVQVDGRTVAIAQADARGEWVAILDAPLPPGGHEFRLVQTPPGGAPVPSDRTVAVLIPPPAEPTPPAAAAPSPPPPAEPAKPDASSPPPIAAVPAPAPQVPTADATPSPPPSATPLVVATPTAPGGASQVLQGPPLARAGDLVLGAVDYDEAGRMTITGRANPGERVRVYLNNQPVGDATAGADGRWTLAPGRATPHGPQRLRVDRLATGGSGVAHRLEVPFERVTVKPGDAVTIVRGDNLWNIARGALGSGERYTTIYEANRNQIRDPNLIYPGQVFVIPKPR